jgi:hypothetical protein
VKIVSVTMTGNNAETIGDALKSVVDEVDLCFVLDTRELVTDGTLDVAGLICGEKLRVARKPWRDDFGHMRTAALDLAFQATKAEWAIWVDTDERIVVEKPGSVRLLAETAADLADAITCWHVSGEYRKERLIRLPRCGAYHGKTHEYWTAAVGRDERIARSQGVVRFDELAKTDEQMRAKLQRDAGLLLDMAKQEPDEPRWPYYLGDNFYNQGRFQEDVADQHKAKEDALKSYMDAASKGAGWGEMRAWAAFRAANILIEAGEPGMAREMAGLGLSDRITPELLWVLAAACLVAEDYPEAIKAATHCAAAGDYSGYGSTLRMQESGHIHPPARFEGPYELIARAYEGLGNQQAADHARQTAAKAKELREG